MKRLLVDLAALPILFFDWILFVYVRVVSLVYPNFGYARAKRTFLDLDERLIDVEHKSTKAGVVNVLVHAPNWLCKYRADSLSTKEPETLEWIDNNGGVLFDIGANVGLYSIYHAKVHGSRVYAFEPSVFNLKLLAKNIFANNFENTIAIVPTPLTSCLEFSQFKLANTEEGGALSAFGVDFDQNGKGFTEKMEFRTLGFDLDFLIRSGAIPDRPTMIKIDVDGIEHLILAGAKETLIHPVCRTVLVEINDNFAEQAHATSLLLKEAGFELTAKFRQAGSIHNQIWEKPTFEG